jgi:hypothetical protein
MHVCVCVGGVLRGFELHLALTGTYKGYKYEEAHCCLHTFLPPPPVTAVHCAVPPFATSLEEPASDHIHLPGYPLLRSPPLAMSLEEPGSGHAHLPTPGSTVRETQMICCSTVRHRNQR